MTRSCGSCSLCCKLPPIKELQKPADQWCVHCNPGNGCRVYNSRPQVCRDFLCEWMRSDMVDDIWRPTSSKMVMYITSAGNDMNFINVAVDPAWPRRWQKEEYYSALKRIALAGVKMQIEFIVRVIEGNRGWIILPNKDVELTDLVSGFKVIKTGINEWSVEQ